MPGTMGLRAATPASPVRGLRPPLLSGEGQEQKAHSARAGPGRGCLLDPRLLECRAGGEAAKTGHSHGQTLKTLTGFFSDNREWWCSQTCLLLTGMKEHTHLWTQMESATNREQNNPPNTWKLTASVKYIKFWQFTWKQEKRKKKKKETNLAKGRFIVQPRASVPMTTCSNFEIKWTVDSVRENKSGLFWWEKIKQMGKHDPCYQTTFLSFRKNTGMSFFIGGTYRPLPDNILGRLSLDLPLYKHARLFQWRAC